VLDILAFLVKRSQDDQDKGKEKMELKLDTHFAALLSVPCEDVISTARILAWTLCTALTLRRPSTKGKRRSRGSGMYGGSSHRQTTAGQGWYHSRP
jgi:hypothetical protein